MIVEVVDGANRRVVEVDGDAARVGRDPMCDVLLAGDVTVSRVHALLERTPEGYRVTDQGSRNGTHLNGRRITGTQRLSPTDRLRVGTYVLLVGDQASTEVETAAADEGGPLRLQLETGLSRREIDVLREVCAGRSDQEIAEALFISVKTVHSHLDRIRDKTGMRRRPELIRYGMERGLA